jgi:hypothetical protein
MFKFHEVPGGKLEFVYRAYKEDKVEKYELIDGQIYDLPLGVARHINKNINYPVHKYQVDEQGKASKLIGQKFQRASFQSMEFMDIDDLGDRVIEEVTVTDIPKIKG